jgi:excisionase family DNA binding protein
MRTKSTRRKSSDSPNSRAGIRTRRTSDPSRNGFDVSELRSMFSSAVVEALEALIEEKVAAALAERENGSQPAWLSLDEVAAYLRVSPSSFGRLLKDGRLGSTYVGRRRLIRRADLDSVSHGLEQ